MIVLSHHQQAVVDAVVAGKNVIVDAVAGSGKTTTAIATARALPGKRVGQITYNRFLKEEVRERTTDLDNLVVDNHHSIAVIYYDSHAHNDVTLELVLNEGVDISPPDIDILIYDETQDKNLLYYRLARDFVRQLRRPPQLLLMGERLQCLYGFKDADERYLTLGHKLWPGYEFVMLDLPESRRVTSNIAQFVNRNMLGRDRILSSKPGPPVEFLIGSTFDAKRVFEIINYHFPAGIDPGEVFVLSPSVRSDRAPFKSLANLFTRKNIPLYVSSNDESEVRDSVSHRKAVFTSFHQSKGRERDIVVVYGMESGYYSMYGRDIPPSDYYKCPSTFYVACTRAKKLLIVVSSAEMGPIEFLKAPTRSTPYMNVSGRYNTVPKPLGPPRHNDVTPSRLVRFIKPAHMLQLHAMIPEMFEEVRAADTPADIPQLIEGRVDDTVEDVSEINGLSIPALWEYKHYRRCTILDHVIQWSSTFDPFVRKFAHRVKLGHDPENMNLAACVYLAAVDELNHRLAQIPYYDWLSEYDVNLCHHWLNEYICENARFEQKVERDYYSDQIGSVLVKGRMDIIDSENVWEIKCTGELRLEHKLQLAIYAWMCNGSQRKMFKLLNIKTGEVQLLKSTPGILDRMMDIVMDSLYGITHRVDDDVFVERALTAVRPRNPATVRSGSKRSVDVVKKMQAFMSDSDDD